MNEAPARIIDGDGFGKWMDLDAAHARAQHGQMIEIRTVSEIRGKWVELRHHFDVDWGRDLGECAGDISEALRSLNRAAFRALPSRNDAIRVMQNLLDEIEERREHVS